MFAYLFFEYNGDKKNLQEVTRRIVNYCDISEDDDSLVFITKDFTLNIKEDTLSNKFKSEDYGMRFNVLFYFDVHANTNWASELMRITGELIKLYPGNCLVESNDIPILLREKDSVIVDDSKLKGTVRFPFNSLGIDYVEGNLDII